MHTYHAKWVSMLVHSTLTDAALHEQGYLPILSMYCTTHELCELGFESRVSGEVHHHRRRRGCRCHGVVVDTPLSRASSNLQLSTRSTDDGRAARPLAGARTDNRQRAQIQTPDDCAVGAGVGCGAGLASISSPSRRAELDIAPQGLPWNSSPC